MQKQVLSYAPKAAKAFLPRLLLTRAKAQAEVFAKQVRAETSLEPIISPMQEMCDLDIKIDLTGISALAFTSKNGVQAFARMSSVRLPAYCVGEATAACARMLGFEAVAAAGTAESLQSLLPPLGVLHLHGQHVTRALGGQNLAIYDQVARPLRAEARTFLAHGDIDAIALFSPRSARLLVEAFTENLPKTAVFYVLSQSVAAAIPQGHTLRVCPNPSAESMLRLLSADFPA